MWKPLALMLALVAVIAAGGALAVIGQADAAPWNLARTQKKNFVAVLSGGQQAPAVETDAGGMVVFHLSTDRRTLYYALTMSDIGAVTAIQIQHGEVGAAGEVVASLSPAAAVGSDGALNASGTLTARSLRGPLAGQSLEDLLAAMRDGSVYINVVTDAYPGGELRGQIR